MDQQSIKRAFYNYANLLKGKAKDIQKITTYLEKSKLPKVSHYFSEALNKEITAEEVINAINEAKIGKSSGPDSLTVRFYRTVKEEVGIQLQEIMNLIMLKTEMLKSWNQASITLIHKEDSEPTNVKKDQSRC